MVSAPQPQLEAQGVSGVKEVVLENFKSYEGQVRVGPFKKFTCVVGPNGAGKSNLMDAISFVLGVKTRHLRSDRLQELVHRGEQEAVSDVSKRRCSVQLVYVDESGDLPRETTFRRVIQPASEARFQIDGEAVSQEVYLRGLEEINIFSKVRNFLVFQGDVEAAAQRQGKDLTTFLEQVSGSLALRAEYDTLAAEKAKREDMARDLYTRKRNAQNEKKRMSQQKDEAERYRSMDSERKKLQAEFTLFRVCCAETKAQEIAKSIQNLREEVDEVQVHQREADQQVEEAEKHRAQVQVAVSNAEKHLQSARSQLHQLSPDQLQARTELEVCERRQQEASKLQELEVERQKRLSEQEEELKSRVQQLEEELQMLKSQSHEMPFSEQQWQQFRRAQEEADRLTSYQSQEAKELEQQIKAKEKQKAMAEMDRREAALRVRHLKQKVESLESCLSVKQKTRASYQSDVQQLTKELQGLAEGQQRWSSAKKKLEDERKVIIEEIQNITATEQQIERERRLTEICQDLGQVVPGVAGRVVNLCQHVQKKYRVAVNVALGNYMDAVITDSIQHARQCVQHLKDRMMEPLTFLPLDNLRAAEGARLQEALRGHPALRPALNCISHDQRHQRAFDFMLSDVVIADSLDDGRRFVFEDLKDIGIKCRVVTLNGETISRDGNLAVSSEAKRGSTRFDFTELETAKQRLEAIEGELIDLQSKHSRENAVYAQVQDSLRQAELVFRDAEQELHRVESELEGRQQELSETEEQLATVPLEDAQQEGLKNQLLDLEQRIGVETRDLFHDLDVQLGQDVRKLDRELRMKREAVQFQEDAILRQQTAFKAELAMVQQTLEERRGRSVALEDEASTEVLKQRHQDLDQQLAALQENIDQEAEALKQQEELLKSQEQAVAAARRALKEKQREASEGERRLSVLGSELKEAREARLQLLCQSLLEDVDLPFLGSKKDCKAALRQIAAGGGPSSHELSVDVQLDYQQLPEERRAAAAGGAASQLLEDEYRNELRRLGGELEQLQPNLKAFNQLDEADQEVMAAEREAQKARKKMEAVERTFEEVRSQRREKFMHCFQQVQDEIQEVYRRLTKGAAAGFEGGSAFLDLEDLEDPWNGGIKFTAMPPSKRFCDMALLSGGEKTVAAMALLFAIQAYQRPPFLVLDEIDAHLDHSNVQALAKFIDSIGCQAIVISQKDRFFSHGEGLVGVSKKRDTSVVFTMDLTCLRKVATPMAAPLEAVPV